jgi:hypothetical protein
MLKAPRIPPKKLKVGHTLFRACVNLSFKSLQNVSPFSVCTLAQETQLCDLI